MEKDYETFTNIIVNTGVPSVTRGKHVTVNAAGWAVRNGELVRFGFEFLDGLAYHGNIASKNAYTVNGKLHKLNTMRLDFDPSQD